VDAGIILAVLGTSVAAYHDLRHHKIPNIIPASMLLLSFPLAIFGGYPLPWFLNILLASILLYFFWVLRVWAAGDSKLLIAVAALIPQYPASAALQQPPYGSFFFLTVIFNLLLVYLLYTILLILVRSSERRSFALILGSVLILSAASYDLNFTVAVPFLFSFIVLRIYSEAGKLEFTRLVPASDLQVGDNLAEKIIERSGGVVREREAQASISSLVGRLMKKDASAPASFGLTKEEKMRLQELVSSGRIKDGIRVYCGTIMSPMILAALLLSIIVGDVLATII
jgi:Flp pilus assembly protein protease CpaA